MPSRQAVKATVTVMDFSLDSKIDGTTEPNTPAFHRPSPSSDKPTQKISPAIEQPRLKELYQAFREGFHEGLIPSKVGYEPSWLLIFIQAFFQTARSTILLIITIVGMILTGILWFSL